MTQKPPVNSGGYFYAYRVFYNHVLPTVCLPRIDFYMFFEIIWKSVVW